MVVGAETRAEKSVADPAEYLSVVLMGGQLSYNDTS